MTTTGPVPSLSFVTNYIQDFMTYIYDNSGKVVTVSNAIGETTITTNDAIGRPVTVAMYNSNSVTPVHITSTYYSPDHNSVWTTNGTGSTAIVTSTYTDTRGNPVLSIGYPGSGILEYTWQQFDADGNRIAKQRLSNNGGAITTWSTNGWTYDGLNRPVTETGLDGVATMLSYDPLGDVTNRAVSNGPTWTATFLNDGRIASEKEFGGGLTNRTTSLHVALFVRLVCVDSLLDTVTDGRSTTRTDSYDDFLRLSSVVTTGTADAQKTTTTYQYDPRNFADQHRSIICDEHHRAIDGNFAQHYDQYGRIAGEFAYVGGSILTDVSQTWDLAGRRSSIVVGGFSLGFEYQADGLMTASDGSSFGYNNNGLLTGRTNSWRAYAISQRDGRGRITQANTYVNVSCFNVFAEGASLSKMTAG